MGERIKLEEISEVLQHAKEAYYNDGNSPLSDVEYDYLVDKAIKLGYVDYVGSKPSNKIPTIKHEHLMLSLDKCHSVEEIRKFINYENKQDVIFMWKADGLSCSATYIDGVLVRLETRGDGEVGNNVMLHADSIKNIPKKINKSGRYVIDGEIVILHNDFDRININGEYSNPRNLASGSLNQLDPAVSAQRNLKFYAWDCIEGGNSDSLYKNLKEAEIFGFDVVKMVVGDDCVNNIEYTLQSMKSEANEIGFPIDGIVVKFDSKSFGLTLGKTDKFFRNAIAYKYKDEFYKTRLNHIEWQLGKTSQITPVAVFDQIEISGTIISRASLHNLTIMKTLGITNHCTCYVVRSNDVIPQIIGCEDDGDGEIEIPSYCPICGGEVQKIKQNSSEVLYCTNKENCKGRVLGKLKHFVSKSGMDINGLSEKTLEVLYNLGLVREFADIFSLREHREKLERVPGFGKKSVDKLLDSIDSAKQNVDLAHFISALSIPGIGLAQAKILANSCGDWQTFCKRASSGYDFTMLEGFGDVNNNAIHAHFSSNPDISKLGNLVDFSSNDGGKSIPASGMVGNNLGGSVFVITGKLKSGSRDNLVKTIEAHGGKVASSVSKNTNYLINNDATSGSSKNVKAKQLGVAIITEDEFFAMIKE